MSAPEELIDPYRVLQVDPTADQEVIQAAYRALARRFHPDVAEDQAVAAQRMAIINAAFDLIRDPQRRAEYDRSRPGGATAAPSWSPGSAAGSGASATSTDGSPHSTTYQPGGHSWSSGASWEGTAGPPPGRPAGSVLPFGRFKGWSLGEVARVDMGYLLWLEEKREGRPYLAEIDELLRKAGVRKPSSTGKRPAGR